MPNRIIKETAFTSDSIAQLSDFQFRLWVGLITQADDAGRGDARAAILKGRIFALRDKVREVDIEKGLQALAKNRSIFLYEVAGKPFYAFPKWAEHQRVRNAKPKYPAPERPKMRENAQQNDHSPQLAANRGEQPQAAAKNGPACARANPIQSESNPNPNSLYPRDNARRESEIPGDGQPQTAKVTVPAYESNEDRWEEFWDAYPKKSGGDIRTACMEYVHAIEAGANPDDLVAGAKALAERTPQDQFRYLPAAEKWLRNKGWKERPKEDATAPKHKRQTIEDLQRTVDQMNAGIAREKAEAEAEKKAGR